MCLLYNMKYPTIYENMSNCQIGARKNRGCNEIIHDVLKSKKNKPIVLQIYDYAQMFDSIDLKQAPSDIYEC